MIVQQTLIVNWLQIIRGEFIEIPGLQLTDRQIQRLWGLDTLTAEAILAALVDARFLRRTRNGAYTRMDTGL